MTPFRNGDYGFTGRRAAAARAVPVRESALGAGCAPGSDDGNGQAGALGDGLVFHHVADGQELAGGPSAGGSAPAARLAVTLGMVALYANDGPGQDAGLGQRESRELPTLLYGMFPVSLMLSTYSYAYAGSSGRHLRLGLVRGERTPPRAGDGRCGTTGGDGTGGGGDPGRRLTGMTRTSENVANN